MPEFKDITGRTFGRLTVTGTSSQRAKSGDRYVKCRCICGVEKEIAIRHLTSGRIQSCGCVRREITAARSTKHGESGANRTSEYSIWAGMWRRCSDPVEPGYHRYGGRGITVCERWRSYKNFLEDMSRRPTTKHSLDRIDNNGSYEPSNCRWATSKEQNRNRSTNRLLTANGCTKTLAEWAEISGVPYNVIHWRIKSGRMVEEALTVSG